MSQKNYYQLLGINPQATAQEIKAAYRKLAFKYHPDRNKGSMLTEAVLKEINEAYRVLSNPEKRKFYNASIAVSSYSSKHRRPTPLTSTSILQHAIKLKTFVERSNVLTINQDLVYRKVQTLLSDHHVHILLHENNKPVIQQFVREVLLCMQPLTSDDIQVFLVPLQKLAAADDSVVTAIQHFYQQKRGEAFWQRYKLVMVLVVAVLLCLLMYML